MLRIEGFEGESRGVFKCVYQWARSFAGRWQRTLRRRALMYAYAIHVDAHEDKLSSTSSSTISTLLSPPSHGPALTVGSSPQTIVNCNRHSLMYDAITRCTCWVLTHGWPEGTTTRPCRRARHFHDDYRSRQVRAKKILDRCCVIRGEGCHLKPPPARSAQGLASRCKQQLTALSSSNAVET